MMYKKIMFTVLTTSILSACSDHSSTHSKNETSPSSKVCLETGDYACKTGETEPLYPFQWALNYSNSFFSQFKDIWKNDSDPENYDLNVEKVHQEGIKGQGINVFVIDSGIDINHEDLKANVDRNMTFNFDNNSNDPTPKEGDSAHGTNVAGIIAAAQNGKGVMGIAPRVNLGGSNFGRRESDALALFGGAEFSKNADIFNVSIGDNPEQPNAYDTDVSGSTIIYRNLPYLRKNKGALFIKAAGNDFFGVDDRICPTSFSRKFSCENPAHDSASLEPTVILVGAANSRGIKSTYSSAGPVNWITGLGGEYGMGGTYGENDPEIDASQSGPTIFSTDIQGCTHGYSKSDSLTSLFLKGTSTYKGLKNNLLCNYSYLNGTSAATPTVSGVVALILQVNPDLTWRDVREILRRSAKIIDRDYPKRVDADHLVDLNTGNLLAKSGTTNDIQDGMTQAPLEFGWQTNGAGIKYSNWYGFGLVDAHAAVKLAKTYKASTLQSKLTIPDFVNAFPHIEQLSYGRVTRLGTISINKSDTVDQFQLRVTGPICVGSVGFFVKSPSGIISTLSIPYNIYYNTSVSEADHFGLGSYTFHGEKSTGQWEVYAVSGDKGNCASNVTAAHPLQIEYRIIPKLYS